MINSTGITQQIAVSVGDLYAMTVIGTSTSMITNHGNFGNLSDTDVNEPDYG